MTAFYYNRLLIIFWKKFYFLPYLLLMSLCFNGVHADESNTSFFIGVTEPVHDVTIGLSVPGIIESISGREGYWVKKGQSILHLRQKKELLEVDLLKMIWENKVDLNAAIVHKEKFFSLYDSAKRLYEKTQSVSREELIKLELRYLQADFQKLGLEELEKQEKIKYDIAREKLRQLSLYAPVKGIISEIFLKQGERCQANQALIRLVNPDTCYFVCNVEEGFSQTITPGLQVDLLFQTAGKTITKQGKVVYISPVVEPASGLLKVKVRFNNQKNAIRPGISGKMMINTPLEKKLDQ